LLGYLLSWASKKGHLKIVRYLHRAGVELNVRNDDPLCRAGDGGHLDIVRYLHQNGGKLFLHATMSLSAGRLRRVT
jgi:hypothetical protein